MKLVEEKISFFSNIELLIILVDLKNEITKEQDCKQKLRQDFLQLRRVRSIENSFKIISFNFENYFRYFNQKIKTS
jgi:hypothetical protein